MLVFEELIALVVVLVVVGFASYFAYLKWRGK
jgi:hypothetical protein